MSPRPILQNCDAKARLSQAVHQSHLEMIRLSEREVGATIQGDTLALAVIEEQLRGARRKHDADMTAFKDHIAEHDCFSGRV